MAQEVKKSHSVRVTDSLWRAGKRRAEQDGTNINAALNEFLEGYARGLINLPRVTKTYSNVATPSATAAK